MTPQTKPTMKTDSRTKPLLLRYTAALFSAALLLAVAGCGKGETKVAAQGPTSVPVTIAVAVKKDMPVSVRSIGNVQAYQAVSIKSQINSQITEVHFKQGQDVNEGDLLFDLDRRQLEADLRRAQNSLLRDDAQAKNNRVQAERFAKLLKEGVVAQQQYDLAVSTAEASDAGVAADKDAVEYAKVQLQYTKIYAPISGRTGDLMVDLGNLVKANDVPLVTINQITPIYVNFSVPEQQLSELKRYSNEGSLHVQAVVAGQADQPIEGKLSFIDNSVDPNTGTIKVKGTFTNPDRRLWPGQFVDVVLTLTTQPNAIVIPSQAVQTGQQGQFVFVIKPDNTADMRPVTVKRTVGPESVVETGLQAGDRVVIDGQIRLIKGSKVEIKTANQQPVAPPQEPRS
ncbi:MAG: efflux transporter, family, subunit [Acidobacteriaceae bacterium]|nr:efflux transporter, family, subunit [Acidobacteriaceae bacterium]